MIPIVIQVGTGQISQRMPLPSCQILVPDLDILHKCLYTWCRTSSFCSSGLTSFFSFNNVIVSSVKVKTMIDIIYSFTSNGCFYVLNVCKPRKLIWIFHCHLQAHPQTVSQSSQNMPDMSGRLLLMSGRGLQNAQEMSGIKHNICWSLIEKMSDRGSKCPAEH